MSEFTIIDHAMQRDDGRVGTVPSRYGLHGMPSAAELDRLTARGAEIFAAPVCAISLIAGDQLLLRSCHGARHAPAGDLAALFAATLGGEAPLVVEDALADPRSSALHCVRDGAVGFFAGAPLIARCGTRLGTLCIVDSEARRFPAPQVALLAHVADAIVDLVERHHAAQIADILVPFAQVAHQALITTDGAGRISFWNDGAEAMFGFTRGEIQGELIECIVPERFRASHRDGLARVAAGAPARMSGRALEVIALRRDGSEFPAELSLSSWQGPLGIGIGAQMQDITERRAREERLQHLADHDHLTGLLNRNSFRCRVEAQLDAAATAAVLVCDLDGFKGVNDDLGHAAGDTLLQALALRMSVFAGAGEALARLGGDEFAILLADGQDLIAIRSRAEALLDVISRPFSICGHQLKLCGSVGIAVAPLQATDTDELLVRADLALFKAKSDGGDRYRIFDSGMENQLSATRAFQEELRFAFTGRQLELHFQPQVDLASGALVGAEALLRWRHPTRGLLFPQAFLAVLETHALAFEAGCWVLDEACRTLAEWRRAGLPALRMGVNLFAAQLHAGMLVDVVEATLARHGLVHRDLELEITESIALRQDRNEMQPLRELHARGVAIAFDDFGTGFASLSALKNFPLSRLKIDRGFVGDLCTDRHSQAIAHGVVTIAHSLGIEVIAEGVETAEQAALLTGWGCDAGQGYLYGKPVGAEDFAAAHLGHTSQQRIAGVTR